ncbi:hypothetical protein RCL1_003230 [Eukaryota sp. TZLM3-RCL]
MSIPLPHYDEKQLGQLEGLQSQMSELIKSLNTQLLDLNPKLALKLEKSLTHFDKNVRTIQSLQSNLSDIATKCYLIRQRLLDSFPDSFDFEVNDDLLPSERFQFTSDES